MPRGYARYVLAVMVGINFLNYLDRYILPAVATKIQGEFHLTDSQVGLLGSAFLLVYAVATIPFGIWADRGVRKTVVAVGVTIWSLATLFTGLARNYVPALRGSSRPGNRRGQLLPGRHRPAGRLLQERGAGAGDVDLGGRHRGGHRGGLCRGRHRCQPPWLADPPLRDRPSQACGSRAVGAACGRASGRGRAR